MLFSTVNSEHSRVSMFGWLECFSHQREFHTRRESRAWRRGKKIIIREKQTSSQYHIRAAATTPYRRTRDRVCWSAWTWAIKLIFVSLELRRECCFVVDNDERRARELELYVNGNFFCCCCCLWSTTSRRRKSTCLCVRVVSLSRVEIFTSWNYFIIIISGRKRRRRKRKEKKNWARNVDIRANIGLNERFMVRIFTASSRWRRRRRWASGVVAFDHIFREIVNTQPRARERSTWKGDIVSRVWSSCQCWPEIIAVTPQLWLKTFKSPHTQFTILSTRARPCEGREEQKNSSEKQQHDSVKKKNRKIIKYNFYHSLFQHCRHDMAPPRCREKALKVRVTPPPIVAYQHRVSLLLITYAKPRMTNVNGGGVLGTCEWEKNRNEIETFPLAYTIWWITQVLILFVFHLRNSLSPIFRQHVHCCDDTNKI